MREFLKKLFNRRPPQQLGLETGPRSASTRVHDTDEPSDNWDDDDCSWLNPPTSLVDPAAWDTYWYQHLSHGVGGFVHLFCDDGELVDTMRANGLKTVLCVGNGISQEPRALAWAGFDVTALDLSPYAMKVAHATTPPTELLAGLVGGRAGGLNGNLTFVTGNLRDPECCPGPFDVVIERLTLQLYSGEHHSQALEAVANRLTSPGIFFSQSHNGGWKPPAPRVHANEWWFRAERWPIWHRDEGPLTTRVAWLFTTTG
jgi:SAM-dependent methyltransferase